MTVQVARIAGAHTLDSLAAQPESLAVLSTLGQIDLGLATQGRNFHGPTQRSGGQANRHGAVQVIAIALEDLVRLDPDLDVQVARRPTVGAGLAVAARTNAHAFVDAGRHLDFQRLVLLDLALATASRAGLGNDLAGAMAMRAGLLDAEEPLAHVHRASAVAGRTDFGTRSGLRAVALAGFATLVRRNADLRFLARRSLFERDLHRVAQVAATKHLLAARAASLPRTATTTAEDVTEDVAECLGKAAESFSAGAATASHVRVHTRVTVLVVGRALLPVAEHFVGLFGLLEFLFGLLGVFPLVAVRVMLHGHLAIGLLDVFFAGVLGNAQRFVIIPFGHVTKLPVIRFPAYRVDRLAMTPASSANAGFSRSCVLRPKPAMRREVSFSLF